MTDSTGRRRTRTRLRRFVPGGRVSSSARPTSAVDDAPTSGEHDPARTIPYGVRLAAAWSWRLLLIGGVLAVVIFLVIQLRLIVIPILVAVILGALLVPFSQFLQRHGWPRWLAITTTVLALLVAVGGLLTLGIWQIARGSADLAEQTVVAWNDFREALLASPFGITEQQLDDAVGGIAGFVQSESGALLSGALSLGSTLGHFVAGMLLALFATIFILIDGRGIWNWIVAILPRRARVAVDDAGQAGWATLQNFVKVQILVATIDAIGIGAGAFLLGVPLAIPIAILVFLGSFVPIVGAVVTGALAVFVALVYNGWGIALAMLGVVLLVQQVEGHILQPLIMGTAVRVHPLGVVVAVATGSFLAGIPGAFFAVPVAAVLNVMILSVASGAWKHESPRPLDVDRQLWRTVPQAPPRLRRDA